MSDLFARLAARTLGVAGTVRPVVAPMFAAPDPVADDPWPEEFAGSELGTPDVPRTEAAAVRGDADVIEAARSPGAQAQRGGLPGTVAVLEALSSGEVSDDVAPLRRASESGAAPHVRDTTRLVGTLGAAWTGEDVSRTELVAAEPVPEAPSRNSPSIRPGRPGRPDGLEGEPAVHASARGASDLTAPVMSGAAPSPASMASMVSSAHVPPLVRLAGAGEPPAAIPAPPPVAETASVAPTIKITIGRIEVRAVPAASPPAAPPRRERAEQPTLSLSDYLKRGGQR